MQTNNLRPDVIGFNAALSACVEGEQWERALFMLAGMQARELMPNLISYSVAISACEKAKMWECALG
eukprot:CAMPEP_0180551708 /NCGR_PEP_ID=MMETSP1036_2-20121128/73348_1 /TAXON_ID=632150 /ORGANISM="Azadinium spinosum, Strain 3D9" /LENGTH=66 /DNA_ID=CAMNT_0022567097 /DNA_START=1 /DNA_END=198 /DNA_ORIENTATION=-